MLKDINGLNKWRNIPFIGSCNIAKMLVLPNVIYRLNIIAVKILTCYFVEMSTDSTVYIERQKTQNYNMILTEICSIHG